MGKLGPATYYNYNKLLNIARKIDWLKYKNDKDPNKIVNGLIKEYILRNLVLLPLKIIE